MMTLRENKMIIYDHARLCGWGILFHYIGSSLLNYKSYVPAALSAILAGFIANDATLQDWFYPRIENGNAVFNSIQFLVSLIVVNRVREASQRFNSTVESYIQFYNTLVSLALMVTACIDNTMEEHTPQSIKFRMRFLRWIRALHVLAVEEFQGYESPKYRMGTLLVTEEILLFKEKRKPTRLMHWLYDGWMKERSRFAPESPVDTNIWRLLGESYATYSNTRRMSSQMYAFPLAQSSLVCCIAYGMLSPFAFGTILPDSLFLAPCVAFVSVWLTFAFNLAAEMLEWPFDGRQNNMHMNYYSIRFIKDIGSIEFGTIAPMNSCEIHELIPEMGEVDYDLPQSRPYPTKKDVREWLERAQKDDKEFSGQRRAIRHKLQPLHQTTRTKIDDILGDGVPELRAKGVFAVLW